MRHGLARILTRVLLFALLTAVLPLPANAAESAAASAVKVAVGENAAAKAAAAEKGLDAEIFAVPAPEVDDILSEKKVDVLLLGPQVRYLLDQFTEKLAQKNIPVGVIPMVDYGMMNGSKVLALAEELIGG